MSEHPHDPDTGYFGTTTVLSGRAISIPGLVRRFGTVTPGDTVDWYVTGETTVAFGCGIRRTPTGWSRIDATPIRVDHSQERVQVPKRFFASYKGPAELPEEVRPGPVPEPAQLTPGQRLHLIRNPDPPQSEETGVLYTARDWEWLETRSTEQLQSLFPTTEQRSTFLGSLTVEECSSTPMAVFRVMNKLFTEGAGSDRPQEHQETPLDPEQ